jgi:hypothetical protein
VNLKEVEQKMSASLLRLKNIALASEILGSTKAKNQGNSKLYFEVILRALRSFHAD